MISCRSVFYTLWANFGHTVALLVVFSFCGTAIRLLLYCAADALVFSAVLSDYYAQLYFDLLPNIVGSAIMGFTVTQRSCFEQGTPLYIGISTGLCGCITTFSGWCGRMARGFTATTPVDSVACFMLEWSSSLASYQCGRCVTVVTLLIPQACWISVPCETYSQHTRSSR